MSSELDPREIGRRLAAAREARRLSQDEVAAVLGVTRVMVSHWERGERATSGLGPGAEPDPALTDRVHNALGV